MPLLPLTELILRREDRRAGLRAMRQARVAADRIFAVEHCRLPLPHLAELARRELRAGANPTAAFLESLALAAIAAQRVLGLRPHLAQMAAAVTILQGRAAELGRGEGKSLALALAAAVRALGGTPVHLVVREDGDVEAQAARMRPFFGALGLGVGAVGSASDAVARREAYQADICIATARELALDHHRDQHRHLHDGAPAGLRRPETACAMIDDIDVLLIDEATASFHPAGALNLHQQATAVLDYFSRYAAVGGASSSVADARRELASLYGIGVTTIASIYPCFRRDLGVTVSASAERWRHAVVARVQTLVAARRAVLVAARDEAAAGLLVDALREAGIDAMLMSPDSLACATSPASPDARHRRREAAVGAGQVAVCSDPGSACRRLEVDAFARAAGGLAVVATHLPSSRRAGRQLSHLAGHRGQPGSVETIAVLPLPGVLARLPAAIVRSLAHARRHLEEGRARRLRRLHARRPSLPRDLEPVPSRRQAPHLQHEGS